MFSIFRREAKASTQRPLVALSQLGAAQWTPNSASALCREGYERNAIGYRCVRMIAEAASRVAFMPDDADHPAAKLLAHPNPDQSTQEMLEAFYAHLQTAGNAFLHALTLEDGAPRELMVMRPDRMLPLQDTRGWLIGWRHDTGRATQTFQREADGWCSVLHMKLFNPRDDLMGYSPLAAAARSIDTHNASGAWAKALLDNSARPSGALIYGQDGARMTDDQFNRLKAELEASHAGAGNAGRPMLLEGGLEWKPMALSPSDMDYSAARHDAAREIALAFGVPPMMLGIPGDNTYSTYKEANLAFWRLTVLPLVEKTARALSGWLSARFETPIIFTPQLDGVSALSAEREALWRRLDAAGFATTDEKRALAGLSTETDIT